MARAFSWRDKMARPSKKLNEQLEALKGFTDDQLIEIAPMFGVDPDLLVDGITRDQVVDLIRKAKLTKTVQIAQSAALPNGDLIECPVGYAIIEIVPKHGLEWGKKSRETFWLNSHGEILLGKRGVPHKVKERFLEVLRNAVEHQLEQVDAGDPAREIPARYETRLRFAEDFKVLAHNPDLEAFAKAEKELQEGAAEYQRAKKQKEMLEKNFLTNLTGIR